MRTYVYDDGRTESVLSYREGGCEWEHGLTSPARYTYMSFLLNARRLGPAPKEPLPPSWSVKPAFFQEDYGLPRGQTLASGATYQSVDAEQLVTLRKVFRKEEAALTISAALSEKAWSAYYEAHREFLKAFIEWYSGPSGQVIEIENCPEESKSSGAFWWAVIALAVIMAIIIGVAK